MASSDLQIVVTLRDKASRALGAIGKKARGVGSAVGTVMRAGVMAGGVAVVGLGVLAVKTFADFDEAMTKSLAIMGDLEVGMRERMEVAARKVAKTTTFSAKEAAEAYFFLASAGLDAVQSIEAMPKVAAFAQAGNFELALATDLLTDAQSALGLTVDDTAQNVENMTRVSDSLIKANTLANATAQQFSEALTNKAGPALRATNKEVEEGLAVLAVFADQGIKGADAGTKFGIALRDLQTKALANKEEFAALDISVYDAQGEMRNMADIVGDLEGALDGMSTAQKKATLLQLGFSDKSVSVIQALLGTSDQIRDYETALRDAGGITEEVKEKQLESFTAQMSLLKSAVMDVLITLGSLLVPLLLKLLPLFHKGSEALQGFISGFERFNDPDITSKGAFGFGEKLFVIFRKKVYPALKSIADFLRRDFFPTFMSGVRTLRPIVEGLFSFIVNNKPALIAAIAAIGIAILLAFGPGAIAVAAIIGLITLIGLLRENWDEIKETVADAVDSIIARIESWIEAVEGVPVIGAIFKATVQVVKDKIAAMISYIKNLIAFGKELVRFFKAVFTGDWAAAWDALKNMAKIALNLLLDFLQLTFVGTLRSIFSSLNLWGWAKGAFQTFKTNAGNFLSGVAGTLAGVGKDIAKGLGNGLKAAKGYVTGGINTLITAVEKGINFIIGAINAFNPAGSIGSAFNTLSGIFGGPQIPSLNIPTVSIPRLDKGGRVLETGLAVVDRGDTFFGPGQSAGGDTYVFNYTHNGALMGNDAEAERFVDKIDLRLRRKWRRQSA